MRVDPEKTQEEILEAAARLFARQGFNKTTVRNISQESGVSEGTIYRVFKGRKEIGAGPIDEIWLALYKKGWSDFIKFTKERIQSYPDNPLELLYGLIKDSLQWLRQDRDDPGLQTTIVMQYRDIYLYFTHQIDDENYRGWFKLIDQIIDKGKGQGIFRKDIDTQIIRETLIGVGERFLMINIIANMTKKHYDFASDLENLMPAFMASVQGFMTQNALKERPNTEDEL